MAAVQGAAREREGLRSRRLLRNPGSSATRSPCRTVQEGRRGVNLRYGHNASAEQFGPRELLAYAQQAEEVGLHTIAISDHFQYQRDLRGAKATVRWEPPKPKQTWPNQPSQQGGDELRCYLDRLG